MLGTFDTELNTVHLVETINNFSYVFKIMKLFVIS